MTTATEPTTERLAPPTPPVRRLRVPQLVVGVVLAAGMALAFMLWHAASVQRTPALALADDLTRGQVLAEEDLRVVHVGTDDRLAATAPEDAGGLVGGVAVVDLPAGTLVVDEHVTAASALTVGAGVVGLELAPGQYPSPQLRVGDLVNVVAADAQDGGGGRLLVEAAEVVWVEPVGTQGQRFVSLLTGEELAGEVAAVAAGGEVRLVQVARDHPTDQQGGG